MSWPKYSRLAAFGGFALVSVINVCAAEKKAPQPPPVSVNLKWKAVDAQEQGDDYWAVRPEGRPKPEVAFRKADGSGKQYKPRVLDPKVFFNDRVFSAELPAAIRARPTFVRFLLEGSAKEDPEKGTILNIDGAILGFQRHAQEPTLAEVVVVGDFNQGARVWKPIGVMVRIDPDTYLTGSPPLTVQLNHKDNTWAVYMQDIVVADGLPLVAERGVPQAKIRAGSEPGDAALLKELAMKKPAPRDESPVKTVGGRIDLAAELAKGTPGVWRGTAPVKKSGAK